MGPRTPCISCLVLAQQENILAENIFTKLLEVQWKAKKESLSKRKKSLCIPLSPSPAGSGTADTKAELSLGHKQH